jgi:hypothetical protein
LSKQMDRPKLKKTRMQNCVGGWWQWWRTNDQVVDWWSRHEEPHQGHNVTGERITEISIS